MIVSEQKSKWFSSGFLDKNIAKNNGKDILSKTR